MQLSPRALDLHRRSPRLLAGMSTPIGVWNGAIILKIRCPVKKRKDGKGCRRLSLQHPFNGPLRPMELPLHLHLEDMPPIAMEEVGRRLRPVPRQHLRAAEGAGSPADPGPGLPLLLMEVRHDPHIAAEVGER